MSSRMESLDMEQSRSSRSATRQLPSSVCGLDAILSIRLNAVLNLAVLGLMITAANIEPWFSYKGTEFSLTGLNMDSLGGWQEYDVFQTRCTVDNLERYKDYRDDCEGLDSYEYAGVLALVFLCIGMTIQAYNTVSAANIGWGFRLGQFEAEVTFTQFPQLLAPITYLFAVLLWVTMIKVAFLATFAAGVGLILSLTATLLDFFLAFHFKRAKTILENKNRFTAFISA